VKSSNISSNLSFHSKLESSSNDTQSSPFFFTKHPFSALLFFEIKIFIFFLISYFFLKKKITLYTNLECFQAIYRLNLYFSLLKHKLYFWDHMQVFAVTQAILVMEKLVRVFYE